MATAAASFPTPSNAQVLRPAEVRTRLTRVRAQLAEIAGRLTRAERRLEKATDAARAHSRALRRADSRRRRIQQALNGRAADLYILGTGSDMNALLGAQDVATFVDRMAYLEQVRRSERGMIEDLRILKRRGKVEAQELRKAQQEARVVRNALSGRQRELDARLREYRTLLRFLELANGRTVYRASRRGPRGFVCPVAGGAYVHNDFGNPRRGGPHAGNDIRASHGHPVVAVLPARVVDTPSGGWIGIGVIIRDSLGNEWWYAHLSSRSVRVGEYVVPGEAMGRVGCTGHCFGSHLHFEWHPGGGPPRDPYRILNAAC